MKKVLALITCLSLCFGIPTNTCVAGNYGLNHPENLIDKNSGMVRQLFWSDEFNRNTLNTIDWNIDLGSVEPQWGSRTYSTARAENVRVQNGMLDIISQISFNSDGTVLTDSGYTGSISTNNKVYFKYGEIEIKAKMAPGKGACSLSYFLGKDHPWPTCGEVDLFEFSNHTNLLTQAIHTKRFNDFNSSSPIIWQSSIDKTKFHIFKLRWYDKKIELYVDNKLSATYNPANYTANSNSTEDNTVWPFNQLMTLNLRGSLDPNLGGERNPEGWTLVKENEDSKDYETHTYVDYVRAYSFQIDQTIKNLLKYKPALYRGYKKKKSKKLIIELFSDDWNNGYEFRVYKTKKNAKKNKKVLVKKTFKGAPTKVKVKNKKLKNKKTLYVRARSYKYCYNVKYYSKWSKPLKVKIKK
ncbi:MAG: glycoside hydrolase family 16 protein [Eubacterium sp.]|nr:glycoside hydrolase family 16 protein [Eubacterium sp.]